MRIGSQDEQYTLPRILLIWFAVTLPMGVAYWVIPPMFASGSYETVVMATTGLTLGLIWQFVLAMIILYQEEGSIGLAAMSRRLWLRLPRNPSTGKASKTLLWLLVPVCVLFLINMMYVAPPIETFQKSLLPSLQPLPGQSPEVIFSPEVADRLVGAWWFFALFMTLSIFNVFLGEEFIFRGVLLPKMNGVFGRWDWFANGVLFGLYHVHQPWTSGGIMLTNGLLLALPAKLFKSIWLSVVPHAIQTIFVFYMMQGLVRGTLP